MDVVQVSKFSYSMLTVLGYFCMIVGTNLFNTYLKEKEYRHLILMNAALSLIMAPIEMMYILRWNLDYGIPDLAILIFDETFSDILSQCFVFLPMQVIFAKITPKHIEGTSFALLA